MTEMYLKIAAGGLAGFIIARALIWYEIRRFRHQHRDWYRKDGS